MDFQQDVLNALARIEQQLSELANQMQKGLQKLEWQIDRIERHTIGIDDNHATELADFAVVSTLTPRQNAIAQMMVRGASPNEIGERLGVSPNTIKTHISMICRKLGTPKKTAAISKLAPIFSRISDKAYERATNGLKLTWDKEYKSGEKLPF